MKCFDIAAGTLLALAASTLAIAPLAAGEQRLAYEATLATPMAAGVVIVMGGTHFSCEGVRCVAERDSRALRSLEVCADLAKRTGGVTAFSARGRAFAEGTVRMCNRKGGVGG